MKWVWLTLAVACLLLADLTLLALIWFDVGGWKLVALAFLWNAIMGGMIREVKDF